MKNQWVVIVEYPNYQVSDCGLVRNVRTGRVLRFGRVNNCGHLQVRLCKKGIVHNMLIHRLVLTAFVGKCPEGKECRHLDGNPSNNHIENLRWGTPSENRIDAVRHGTHVDNSGEAHGNSKLTGSKVLEIRGLGDTMLQREIGKRFGVCEATVSRILNRKTWTHI